MVLVRDSELLAAMCAAGSEYSATVLSLHALAETVLVHAAAIVWLECSFHFIVILLLFCFIVYNSQFGLQKYVIILK